MLDFAEEMPEYPEGDKALKKDVELYISQKDIPIQLTKRNNRMVIRFVVLENGKVGQVRIMNGIKGCDECSELAVETGKMLNHKFTPGEYAGKAVSVWFTMPIKFEVK